MGLYNIDVARSQIESVSYILPLIVWVSLIRILLVATEKTRVLKQCLVAVQGHARSWWYMSGADPGIQEKGAGAGSAPS